MLTPGTRLDVGVALAASLALAAIAARRLPRAQRQLSEVHRRGAVIGGKPTDRRRHRRRHRNGVSAGGQLHIAGNEIATSDETKHFQIIGTTGTGKTTAIQDLLSGALARGDRAVITDPNGAYLERFYDLYRGDVILNPFERHAVRWDPFAEVHGAGDFEHLARGLIARGDGAAGAEWRGYARTFLAAMLRRAHEAGGASLAGLWYGLAVAPSSELHRFLAGTPAEPFLDPDNARMFSSIRSVAVAACAALEHIRAQRAAPFSVRDWVTGGRGVLFIPYRAREVAALRGLMAAWVRLAIFEKMSIRERARSPMWYVVDELDALGAIDGLADGLARLRQFSGRCVLGLQSIAQVSSTYGAGEAQTIVENCGNTLILRCAASEHGGTAQFASKLIGEREVVRRYVASGHDRAALLSRRGTRVSKHVSRQVVTEAAVLPAQIAQLPDLAGYLKTTSCARWVRVDLARSSSRWRSFIWG